jgi:maleate isomerase
MAYTSWRGVIGTIKPGATPGSREDLIRILPEGVGCIPLHMDLPSERAPARLQASQEQLTQKIELLVEQEVDVILPEGTVAFMGEGIKSEQGLLKMWAKRFKTPIIPTGLNLVNAMKAMGMKRVIGIRPFTWAKGNDFTARYFKESGFDVLALVSPEGYDHTNVPAITQHDIYKCAKKAFLEHPKADGIFTVAGIMRVGTMGQTIEEDLGIPVVSNLAARCWQVQKCLHIHQPMEGYGRLLREIP